MRIVVIGNSPASFFLSQKLDQEYARNVHVELTYISDEDTMYYQPSATLVSKPEVLSKKALLHHSTFRKEAIKSINLLARRIITDKDIIGYDVLVLDQTPIFTVAELVAVKRSFQELSSRIRLQPDQIADIYVEGEGAASWQLALSLRNLVIERKLASRIAVACQLPKLPEAAEFLRTEGIRCGKRSNRPGFRVAAPQPVLETQKVKGLRIDAKSRAITDSTWSPKDYPFALVIDNPLREYQTLLRAEHTFADELLRATIRRVEVRNIPNFDSLLPSLLLEGSDQKKVLVLGRMKSTRVRAHAAATLDKNFWRKLKSRSR